jgi:4-hydroxyphenylacetate 3-monooxygenase
MNVDALAATRNDVRPMNGAEYLDSLKGDREIYIYGERIKDVGSHPAFRNSARMVARMYDALHDPAQKDVLTCPTDTGNGGFTHRFFRVDRSSQDTLKTRDAIAGWARMSYGWMGRSPDYKASFTGTLGANNQFYGAYAQNAKAWYKKSQERCLYLNHAIVNPPIDRQSSPEQVRDVYVHVEKETDAGVIISGAKVVATGSALTNANFVAYYGQTPLNAQDMAIFAIVPMDAPGVKLICRPSYEYAAAVMGSPFDYPLSSRLDENDSVLIFDKVFVPWEDVLLYRDVEAAAAFYGGSGFTHRFALQGCTRLGVKLDFIAGCLLKAVEMTGTKDFRGVQAQIGEVMAWRNMIWSLTEAMAAKPEPWVDGTVLPSLEAASAYRVLGGVVYPRVKEIIEQTVASGLIYVNSHSSDWKNADVRPMMDRFMRGSNGHSAEQRAKVMKLLWDAVGTEFGGRHELYERNYAGSAEAVRVEMNTIMTVLGKVDEMKGLADTCMSEYDLNGWTVPDLINPDDVSIHQKKL